MAAASFSGAVASAASGGRLLAERPSPGYGIGLGTRALLPLAPAAPPQPARGAGRYVDAPYRWKVIEGAGHYPHEERPSLFDAELLGWLADPEPER